MSVNIWSDRVYLQIDFGYELDLDGAQLWQTFRRTAVEPGQASSPDLVSFTDECLLCAGITIKAKNSSTKEDRKKTGSLFDATVTPGGPGSSFPENQNIGLIYLHTCPTNLPAGEANIGVIIKRDMQGRGYAREAVQLVLRWAFEELKFHRVQAAILDTPFKDRALRLFIGSGFAHEGTKRRAVHQPEGEGMPGTWKDVTYLAMLDTEWMLRSTLSQRGGCILDRPIVSLWDEMFGRHSREREELLRWEEKHGRIRRSSSTETLRENMRRAVQDLAYLTDDAASSVGERSVSGSLPPSPRPNPVVALEEEDAYMAEILDSHEIEQGWEHVVETSFAARRHREGTGSFLEPSPRGPTLALPSIPSTRLSEGNVQSPLTIPSPGGSPPLSPSPSSTPSFIHSPWDNEDEDNWLQREEHPPESMPTQLAMPHSPHPHTGPSSLRSRSRSSSASSSSTDSWSDAQSSVGTNWDVVSDTSDYSPRGRF